MKSPIHSLASSQHPALTDDATLAAALGCLSANVYLNMHGPYILQTLFQVLLRATRPADSIYLVRPHHRVTLAVQPG
ncbi:MAG: hypothetical protein AAF974_03795 [Cyanobacteria bacterium P01_E01_bin.34]